MTDFKLSAPVMRPEQFGPDKLPPKELRDWIRPVQAQSRQSAFSAPSNNLDRVSDTGGKEQ